MGNEKKARYIDKCHHQMESKIKRSCIKNYIETYSPVAMWTFIRTLLILSVLNKWHTRQVDFVLAFPQAPIEYELFMKLSPGIKIKGVSNRTHCLQLLRNLYGQKQAGRVWNRYLVEEILNISFLPSKIDECFFYKGNARLLDSIHQCID